jgi:hypothetical protein
LVAELGVDFSHARLRFCERRALFGDVDLGEELPGFDRVALVGFHLQKASGDFGADRDPMTGIRRDPSLRQHERLSLRRGGLGRRCQR